jgi:cytochrome oxidase Cu insertion factor (SCO1/SenC/PrrC family)
MAVAVEQIERPSVSRRRLRIFLMYILPPLIALFVVLLPLLSTVSILPRIRVSPGFALIDQQGNTLTNEDLRGEIILYGIVSLNCDEGCVATIDAMRQAAAEANVVSDDPGQPDLRLVTIVVDPVVESARLADFASRFKMDTGNWSVVSGSESAVRAVVGSGFEVYLAKSANGETLHDPGVFLTDHAGFLRAEYRTGNPRPSTIAADIERIVNEANAGAIGGLFYNAAHSLSLSCGG